MSEALSRGFIDVISPEGGTVRLDGWALPSGDARVDRLEAAVGHDPLEVVELAIGLESPDIHAAYPGFRHASAARFSLRARLDRRQKDRLERSLVRVTPYTNGERLSPIFNALKAAIPRPSREAVDVIGGNYDSAFEFLSHFVALAGLGPDERVLDVGCGVGRMAIPLAFYLSPRGRYRGFDIAESGIAWARDVIGSRFPNFEFGLVNVRNAAYNPSGTLLSTEFDFPYPDRSFDFAFLTSVFTHLRGGEVRHYLDEVARVLDTGGRCLATAFLLCDESRRLIAEGKSTRAIAHPVGGDAFTSEPELPENAIGFDEGLFLSWIESSGLRVAEIHLGSWCGRERFASYQDILVLTRPFG